MERKPLRLCLIGFGNAAKAFCKLLDEKSAEIERDFGQKVLITAIAGRSKGTLLDEKGIDLPNMLKDVEQMGKLSSDPNKLLDWEAMQVIEKCSADVLVELSTLSIKDGQPAISHIDHAFSRNMHVITANKGPIAWDFERLNRTAKDKGMVFLYETTVMDGTPIFNLVRETLPGCKVLSFKGILNSTTNFILEEMERGAAYEEAVKEAQRRGFAEADPSMDVDGWDAAAKTAAIANAIMGAGLNPMEVDRTGIGQITAADIKKAAEKGKKIKLVCEAYMSDGKVIGRVHPAEVDRNDIFSLIDATSSIVAVRTDLMGEISIIEKDPEIEQTAYGIFSDTLTMLRKLG